MSEEFVKKTFPLLSNVRKIGEGGYANIYLFHWPPCSPSIFRSDEITASVMKVSREEDTVKLLKFEKQVYQVICQDVTLNMFVPKILFYVESNGQEILGMELLGKSLFDIFLQDCKAHFSLKSVFMIMYQMLYILQFLHSSDVYHLDIKDQNILIGLEHKHNQLFLVDFGLSMYIDGDGNVECLSNDSFSEQFGGGYRLDQESLKKIRKIGRDRDLIDLLKMAAFFLAPDKAEMESDIPWDYLQEIFVEQKEHELKDMFFSYPCEFWDLLFYFINVGPLESIDYEYMRYIVWKGAAARNIEIDWDFDWN